MTRERYHQLLVAQAGRCAICGTAPKQPHVDHDHRTGAIRGLLCHRCNLGLGAFRDHVETIKQAIGYLQQAT